MNGFDAGDVADAVNAAADFMDGDGDQAVEGDQQDGSLPEETTKPDEETKQKTSRKAAGASRDHERNAARARIGLSPTRRRTTGHAAKSVGKNQISNSETADGEANPVVNGEDATEQEKKPRSKTTSFDLTNGKEQPRKKKLLTREQRYGRFRDRSRSPEKPTHHGSLQEITTNDYHDSLEDIPEHSESPRSRRRSRASRDRGLSPDRKVNQDRGMSPERYGRSRDYGSPERNWRSRDSRGGSPDRYATPRTPSSGTPRSGSPTQGRRSQGQAPRSSATGRSKHAAGHHGRPQSFECETCLELLEQVEKLKVENTALKGKLQTTVSKPRRDETPRGGKIPDHVAQRYQMKSIGKGIYVHRVHLQDALGRVDDGNAMVRILIKAIFPPEHIANGTLSALDTEGRIQLEPDVINAVINWTMLHKQCRNSRGDLRYTIVRMLPSKRNRSQSAPREPYTRNR